MLANLVLAVGIDAGPPALRDPEYGYRLEALRQRRKEHPTRPLVLVVGSSRTAQGVRPDVLEPSDSAPIVFNFSQSGAGPLIQLLTLRRLFADGIAPAAVVLEVWPPLLRGDGPYDEECRINASRLRPVDEPTVRQFFATPDATWRKRNGDSCLPLVGLRRELVNRTVPKWLPDSERTDFTWKDVDGWGWWPGRMDVTAEQVEGGWPSVEAFYRPAFLGYTVGDVNDRALRACLAECDTRCIPVVLARLPESTRFQTLKSPEAEAVAESYIATLDRPVLDCRTWAADEHLPDGFHLTRDGATAFTRRFAADGVLPWVARLQNTTHAFPAPPSSP